MDKELCEQKVHYLYWQEDVNCATAMLKILAEKYEIKVEQQVFNALLGMHGAGKYGAQCGLVEGAIAFTGIYGVDKNLSYDKIISMCNAFAKSFEEKFGSLGCKDLRPNGFKETDLPHLCEKLTAEAVMYALGFFAKEL